jgi:ketosteroid isomerase-like protein
MSRQNVEAVRQVLAAISQRDLSRLLELTDPEIEWRSFFAAVTETGEYHGHDGMREYVRDLNEAFEWLRPEIGDLLDAGDLVVGIGRIYFRGKGSGIETDSPAGWVFRFRDGRLLRFRAFRDPEQALEAVGLGD